MKTLAFLLLASLPLSYAWAQRVDRAKLELDIPKIGVGIPFEFRKPGLSLGIETRYNLSNKISIGLGSQYIAFSSEDQNVDFQPSYSFLFLTDFYINRNKPNILFLGLGLGMVDIGGFQDSRFGPPEDIPSTSSAAIAFRTGINFVKFQLTGQYLYDAQDSSNTHYIDVTMAYTLKKRKENISPM